MWLGGPAIGRVSAGGGYPERESDSWCLEEGDRYIMEEIRNIWIGIRKRHGISGEGIRYMPLDCPGGGFPNCKSTATQTDFFRSNTHTLSHIASCPSYLGTAAVRGCLLLAREGGKKAAGYSSV